MKRLAQSIIPTEASEMSKQLCKVSFELTFGAKNLYDMWQLNRFNREFTAFFSSIKWGELQTIKTKIQTSISREFFAHNKNEWIFIKT